MDKELTHIQPTIGEFHTAKAGRDEDTGHYAARKSPFCLPTARSQNSPKCQNSKLLAGTWVAFALYIVCSVAITTNVISQAKETSVSLNEAGSQLVRERTRLNDEQALLKEQLQARGIDPNTLPEPSFYRRPSRSTLYAIRRGSEDRWKMLGRELDRN